MSGAGMGVSAEADLLASLLAALRDDTGVQIVLGNPARLYDDETKAPAYPFARLEGHEVVDAGSSEVAGHAHTLTLAAYSQYGGRVEAREVLGALRVAAEAMGVTLSGQRIVLVLPIYSDVMRTRDRRRFRGVLRLRIVTEEAA